MGSKPGPSQDELYDEAARAYGAAIERLVRASEFDPDKRRDLSQEIHIALWRSFAGFEARCSLRTWTYRVAHNTAASHVIRHRRAASRPTVGLDQVEQLAAAGDPDAAVDRQRMLEQLHALIARLHALDRQVILLYLEGFDAASIGEVTGLSPGNAGVKIHRVKKILAGWFRQGDRDGR